MKIIQIITASESFGGAEAHVRDLAIGLRARGHDCVVMGPCAGSLLADQLKAHGVPLVSIPALQKPVHPVRDLVGLLQVVIAMRRFRPDVIATHTSKAGLIGRVAARLAGIPSFFTPHGLSFINRQNGGCIRWRLLVEQLALRLGSKMIAVCEAERALAMDWLKIRQSDIVTIHNGLPPLDPHLRLQHKRPIITMIARFDVQKDHATLFRALATLLHLDWELRLGGSGPLLAPAVALAQSFGLSSRISFMNQCSDPVSLLAQTDIFALITNWEAFPVSILEAMRAGLPIVATDIGGVSEAVEDCVNGFLIPVHDDAQLAQRLALLIDSAALRGAMGSRSRCRFTRDFEWRSMLDKTALLYTSAAKHSVRSKCDLQHNFCEPGSALAATRSQDRSTMKRKYTFVSTANPAPQDRPFLVEASRAMPRPRSLFFRGLMIAFALEALGALLIWAVFLVLSPAGRDHSPKHLAITKMLSHESAAHRIR